MVSMFRRFFRDTAEYTDLTVYMARSGLKAEVANSYLNWIWWVLEPLASMLVYYLIFVNILGKGQPYYVVYIYTGTLIWSYFNRCVLFAVSAVRLNRDIITKTYVPKPILLLSNMLFNSIKMLISAAILAVLFAVQGVPLAWSILWVLPLLVLLQMLTFGFCLILLHFGVFVEDLAHAIRIVMNIVLYLTGVFYDLRTVLPAPWGSILVRVNPLAMIISAVRDSMLYGKTPDLITAAVWLVLSAALCAIGLRLCYRYENTYVKVI